MGQPCDLVVEPARPEDVPAIIALIRELAEFERLAHEVQIEPGPLREHLFGARPYAEAIMARVGTETVGFALFFHNYSTFAGRPGIYLEDLYVRPEARGKGVGRELLAHLAALAVSRHCARLEWAVLDWNRPAIAFYEKLGAVPMHDWTVFRVSGEPLRRLGARASARNR